MEEILERDSQFRSIMLLLATIRQHSYTQMTRLLYNGKRNQIYEPYSFANV